jgi:hypothetical protein
MDCGQSDGDFGMPATDEVALEIELVSGGYTIGTRAAALGRIGEDYVDCLQHHILPGTGPHPVITAQVLELGYLLIAYGLVPTEGAAN